ncbi:hypothetical protein DIPPA_12367 [Diplonema papillatum]|nr:hypothetical protein DIPPA_12367 [Diplonema papillatum]
MPSGILCSRALVAAAALLLISLGGAEAKKKVTAFPGLTKHVGCTVCKEGVRNIELLVKHLAESAPTGRLTEDAIQQTLDKSCDPRRPEGRWLRHMDIVADVNADTVTVVDSSFPAKLKRKTRSLADACTAFLLGDSDLSGMLYSGRRSLTQLVKHVCLDGGETGEPGPCSKKFRKGPISKKVLSAVAAEELVEADDKEIDAEKQMAEMEKPHLPEGAFKMYSRDNIDEMAIDELMKESGMDEEEATEYYNDLKAQGYFDNPSEHMHDARDMMPPDGEL